VVAVFAAPKVRTFGARATRGSAMTEQKNAAKNLDQRMLSFVDPLGR
jgi:hypothetical protein